MVIGYSSPATSNSYCTLLGYNAGEGLTSTSNNTIVGSSSALNLGTSNNTLIGSQIFTGGGTTASANTAVGAFVLNICGSGGQNTAIGYQAMKPLLAGSNNTSLGYQTLFSGTGYSNNTAIGYESMYNMQTSNNAGMGYQTLYSMTGGTGNTAIGNFAGYSYGTGNNGTFLGVNAGFTGNGKFSGDGNIIIGANAQPLSVNGSYQLSIGDNKFAGGNLSVLNNNNSYLSVGIGNTGYGIPLTSANTQITITNSVPYTFSTDTTTTTYFKAPLLLGIYNQIFITYSYYEPLAWTSNVTIYTNDGPPSGVEIYGTSGGGEYLQIQFASSLNVGVYMLETMVGVNQTGAIMQTQVQINGNAGYTVLRSSLNLYTSSYEGSFFNVRDIFTVTVPGQTGYVQYVNNGKDPSSGAYTVNIYGLVVTQLG